MIERQPREVNPYGILASLDYTLGRFFRKRRNARSIIGLVMGEDKLFETKPTTNDTASRSRTELHTFRTESLKTGSLPLESLRVDDFLTLWFGTDGYGSPAGNDRLMKLRKAGEDTRRFVVEFDDVHDALGKLNDGVFPPDTTLRFEVSISPNSDSGTVSDSIDRGSALVFSVEDSDAPTAQDETSAMTLLQAQIERTGLKPAFMFSGDEYSPENPTNPSIYFVQAWESPRP